MVDGKNKDATPGEVLVRVNPVLWRTDVVQIGELSIGHTEPYVGVSERDYEKLSKHITTVIDNDGEPQEYQQIVRV